MLPPTTPVAPRKPCSTSTRCIEPPSPRQSPASRPISSAIVSLRGRTLGNRVAVAAVARVHGIGGAKLRADTDGNAFLPRAQVNQAVDLTVAREPPHAFLEQPNPPHRGEQVELPARQRAAALSSS